MKCPAQHEQGLHGWGLVQLFPDDCKHFITLLVHLVLRVEQGAALLVALGFEGLDLLLPDQLLLQRQSGRGRAARFLDLAVDFLDFPFQPPFRSSAQRSSLSASASKKRVLRSETTL